MEVFVASLPLLFWIGGIVVITLFIVKKVNKNRKELENQMEQYREEQQYHNK